MKSSGKIRTLIVDDEASVRRLLANLLDEEVDIEIVGEAASVDEASDALQSVRPDLLFLDIRMPDGDGFDLIHKAGIRNMPVVIFISTDDEYALKTFDISSLDYLIKPIRKDRCQQALAKVRGLLAAGGKSEQIPRLRRLLQEWQYTPDMPPDYSSPNGSYIQRFFLKEGKKRFSVRTNEIDWIESSDHYVGLHVDGKKLLLYESMSGLESKLDPTRFVRIHRTLIVNVKSVTDIRTAPHGSHELILQDNTSLRISRRRKACLKQLLQSTGK